MTRTFWVATVLVIGVIVAGIILVDNSLHPPKVVLDQPPARQTWQLIPMTGGPAVYTACVDGVRLFAMNKQAWRHSEGLWPDVALAISPVGCRVK